MDIFGMVYMLWGSIKPQHIGLTIMWAAALVATREAEQAVSTVTLGPVRPAPR